MHKRIRLTWEMLALTSKTSSLFVQELWAPRLEADTRCNPGSPHQSGQLPNVDVQMAAHWSILEV